MELYRNKEILAPMVRVGTLPLRLLALEFGADLVYSPEVIDKRIIASERRVNEKTGVVEYVDQRDFVNFLTHPSERSQLVFQLGTADPDLALQAALKVKQDVAGIDVNCGCPKKFSIQGGMGAALLSNPDKLQAILINLVQNSGLPVTCKIRMLETKEKTLEICRLIESTGVKALAVHCRTKNERPRDRGHWEIFKDIVESVTSIPIIANGDIFKREDIVKLKQISNVSSIMIARAARDNVSIFRSEGLLQFHYVVVRYIKRAIDTNNPYPNTKYTLMQMYAGRIKDDEYNTLVRAKTYEDLCELYNLVDHLRLADDTLTRGRAAANGHKDKFASESTNLNKSHKKRMREESHDGDEEVAKANHCNLFEDDDHLIKKIKN